MAAEVERDIPNAAILVEDMADNASPVRKTSPFLTVTLPVNERVQETLEENEEEPDEGAGVSQMAQQDLPLEGVENPGPKHEYTGYAHWSRKTRTEQRSISNQKAKDRLLRCSRYLRTRSLYGNLNLKGVGLAEHRTKRREMEEEKEKSRMDTNKKEKRKRGEGNTSVKASFYSTVNNFRCTREKTFPSKSLRNSSHQKGWG